MISPYQRVVHKVLCMRSVELDERLMYDVDFI